MVELVSFEELKTFLGLEKTEADYPQLTLIQESVVVMFEDFTVRIFEPDTYVETFEMNGFKTRMISLQALPIQSVTSVTVDGTVTTDFKVRTYGIELGQSVRDVDVVVTYVGGLEEVPFVLNRAALLQTVYEFQNKNSVGLEFVTTDGGSVTKPELGMLKEVKTLLKKQKHPLLL